MPPPTLASMLGRVARLRCPACGRGRLFRGFFVRADACPDCRHRYERGEGYWVGGAEVHMFASYGLSVLVCVPGLVIFGTGAGVAAAVIAVHVALSLTLFRYSRALFLGIDYYVDPAAPPGRDGGGGAPEPVRPRTPPSLARRGPLRPRASRREREPVLS